MLLAVASQVSPDANLAYWAGEPERLARPVLFAAQRTLHTADEWSSFFREITDPKPLESWKVAFSSELGIRRRHNVRAFSSVCTPRPPAATNRAFDNWRRRLRPRSKRCHNGTPLAPPGSMVSRLFAAAVLSWGLAASDMMATQVLLDRAGFSPGEIDGRGGRNTQAAIRAFEAANKTTIAEALAAASEPATIRYTITTEDASAPFVPSIPEDMMEKAKLKRLDYTSLIEMLAERFHASPKLLERLNPGAGFAAGEEINVPNVITVSDEKAKPIPDITVTVSKAASALTVTDPSGKVLMHAPVTSGSQHDPLPIGSWTVTAVARNPWFNYNPELFWDADPAHAKAKVPPGPNGPVGLVWIDISKPHYGIHGTPEPATVGHTTSHGCVRLTNWDALKLAAMVGKGTKVEFSH
jgi:lipoprotein-anchoring transpeptidase ErfK/SrfK